MIPQRVKGLADMDPLPELPDDAARAGLDGLVLAMAAGPRLTDDPHAVLKMNNFDRLIFGRMPILCSGKSPLRILHTWEMRGLVMLTGDGE